MRLAFQLSVALLHFLSTIAVTFCLYQLCGSHCKPLFASLGYCIWIFSMGAVWRKAGRIYPHV